MKKKYRSKHILSSPPLLFLSRFSLPIAAVLFFFLMCIGTAESAKSTGLFVILATLLCGALGLFRLQKRITPPFAALFLLVLMDALTLFYAPSGKFALSEFLQVVTPFCLATLLLLFARGEGVQPGRWMASVLSAVTAASGLISVDLLSTRLISGPILDLLSRFTPRYSDLSGVEPGIRMTSMFLNPNTFAGIAGIGVLLSLGLALSASSRREKVFHLICLYGNALPFVLAFSLGASAAVAVAFLAYLALEPKERRTELFLLMLNTFVFTLLAAAVISLTSFQGWQGVQPAPLAALVLGAAALCLTDRYLGARAAEKLRGSKKLPVLIGGTVAALAVFLLAAYHLTGAAVLRPGEGLRRAAYPDPGAYTLSAEADGPVWVTVESQNQRDTMMHTSTILYQGELSGGAFTVPEDSLVVYFNFSAEGETVLSEARYEGEADSASLPLGYKLLPSFIANRLQGLWANQNAIQRLVFFADGMKLFRRSPLIGLGLGAFENGVTSVQSFYYETRYAHNHYVQALVDTGIVGLALFVGLLLVSAAAVLLERKREQSHPLTGALGAALVFMAGHAATEVVFSNYAYLAIAFGIFAAIGLCCGSALPQVRGAKGLRWGVLAGMAVLLVSFAVPLWNNMEASRLFAQNPTLEGLVVSERIDKFEWSDYALSYVVNTTDPDTDPAVRRQADEYAQRLSHMESNIIPYDLAEYYLQTGRMEQGIAMLKKYVSYVSADPSAWQSAFYLLSWYEDGSETFRSGVAELKELMDRWNEENMGEISVDEATQDLFARVLG